MCAQQGQLRVEEARLLTFKDDEDRLSTLAYFSENVYTFIPKENVAEEKEQEGEKLTLSTCKGSEDVK